MQKAKIGIFLGMISAISLAGCGSKSSTGDTTSSATEDNSPSSSVAGAVGGALSSTSSAGTQANLILGQKNSVFAKLLNLTPNAYAATSCPTFKSTGSDCTVSGSNMWLSYSGCNFGTSLASWTGTQLLSMNSGTAKCGTFPTPPATGNLVRQYVTTASSTTPSTATVTSAFGTKATLDDSTSNLGNFNGDSITAVANGGYGIKVVFNSSGLRTSLAIARRIFVSGGFDHSITTGGSNLSITESSGATSRTVTGSITVYHNLVKVIGTSVLSSVTHTDGCCFPTSGTITTSFTAGNNVSPTTAGSALVGTSEVLTFTGCGTGTLVKKNDQGTTTSTTDVTLSKCF